MQTTTPSTLYTPTYSTGRPQQNSHNRPHGTNTPHQTSTVPSTNPPRAYSTTTPLVNQPKPYSRSTTTTGTGYGYRKKDNLPNPGAGPQQATPVPMTAEEREKMARIERWRKVQEHWLEPGVSNRLVLSLRSRLPAEMDFALSTLVKASGREADLVRFGEVRGLSEALVAVVDDYLEGLIKKSEGKEWADREKLVDLRRATEAMLVLRNATLDKVNQKFWLSMTGLTSVGIGNKTVLKMLCSALELKDEVEEIRGYALEMLDYFCPHMKLAPVPATNGDVPITSFHDLDTSVKLFPLLLELTQSPDRLVVLNSYRCLGGLALVDANGKMFILSSIPPSTPIYEMPPLYRALFRAIELVTLLDPDLQITVLEFIYHISCHPSNAAYLCTWENLGVLLNQLRTRFEWGARRIDRNFVMQITKKGNGTNQDVVAENDKSGQLSEDGSLIGTRLAPHEMSEILNMPEPKRTHAWLEMVFEASPGHEILQVDLWKSYQANFMIYPDRPPLVAADVIKATSEAIPGAQPQVSDVNGKKRFIINGMKVKSRLDLKRYYQCKWENCSEHFSSSPIELYTHMTSAHLNHVSDHHAYSGDCGWTNCTFQVSKRNVGNEGLRLAELQLHVRTHIPSPPVTGKQGDKETEQPPSIRYTRYQGTADEQQQPTGISLLAALTIRNLARAINEAIISSNRRRKEVKKTTTIYDTEGESILLQISRAAKQASDYVEVMVEDDDPTAREGVGPEVGATALMAIERHLYLWTVDENTLGDILGEVLAIIKSVTEWYERQDKNTEDEETMEVDADFS